MASSMILAGKVVSGFGKAKNHMNNEHYKEQFIKYFEFTPEQGTLNIKIDSNFKLKDLESFEKITIEGNDRTIPKLGSVTAYKIKINDSVSGALIFPEKSTHEKIILEIIAPFNLRETFNIVEGDEVKIELL